MPTCERAHEAFMPTLPLRASMPLLTPPETYVEEVSYGAATAVVTI